MTVVPVQFPLGEILDRDAFVWTTLPPATKILAARIVGTCSVDPHELALVQVTIEQADTCLDLLAAEAEPFPQDRGLLIDVPGSELLVSTDVSPIKITIHVRRSKSSGAVLDERGRILTVPDPVTFQLVVLAHTEERPT